MVEILLHYNADPTLQNTKNETAYSLAVKSGRKVVSMILAEADRKYCNTVHVRVCVLLFESESDICG
jgi:heterodisulfide reductase subunit B